MNKVILLKYQLLAVCFLLVSITLLGQPISQIHREFPIELRQGERYFTFLLGDKGCITVHSTRMPVESKFRELRLTHYNTDLDTLWSESVLVDFNSYMRFSDTDSKYWYLMLNDDSRFNFILLRTEISSGITNQYKLADMGKIEVSQFRAANGKVFLGGEVKGFPTVLTFDTQEDQKDVLNSLSQLDARLQQLVVSEKNNQIIAVLKGMAGTRDQGWYVNTYTLKGQMLYKYKLPYNPEYDFINFRPYIINEHELLLFGTYSLVNDYLSQGVYVVKLSEGFQEYERFYDFGYLKRFFKFMPEKKQKRIARKFSEKRNDEKHHEFRYNILLHELVETDKQLLLSGELITISSRSTLPSTLLVSPYAHTNNTLPDGNVSNGLDLSSYIPETYYPEKYHPDREMPTELEYEQAFTCGFDKNGKLLWDNSYKFDHTDNETPIQLAASYAFTDSVFFIEAREADIRFKGSPLTSYTDSTSVHSYIFPVTEKNSNRYLPGGIRHWYKTNFLFSGIRHYKVQSEEEKDNRKVYFLTKITLMKEK